MRPTAAPSAPSAPTRHTRRGAALVIAGSLLGLGAFLGLYHAAFAALGSLLWRRGGFLALATSESSASSAP